MADKAPAWFHFYYQDFRDGVRRLNLEQIGAYMLLMIEQFEQGVLPRDVRELEEICSTQAENCDAKRFAVIWAKLASKFEEVEEGFINEKMAEVREKTIKRWDAAVKNGRRGGRPKNRPVNRPVNRPPNRAGKLPEPELELDRNPHTHTQSLPAASSCHQSESNDDLCVCDFWAEAQASLRDVGVATAAATVADCSSRGWSPELVIRCVDAWRSWGGEFGTGFLVRHLKGEPSELEEKPHAKKTEAQRKLEAMELEYPDVVYDRFGRPKE